MQSRPFDGVRERIGAALGALWAPAIAGITRLRHSRMFHPAGHTFAGTSTLVDGGPFEALGRELTGRVLARCSAALWKGGFEHLDVLGLALRIRRGGGELDETPRPGDQDLLTATIRSPLTMLASPLFTDASDFTGNRYWAVSPFDHPDAGRIELRLVPVAHHPKQPGTRVERLAAAVDAGHAAWWLQARRTLTLRWHSVVRIALEHPLDVDQEALAFDPFRGSLRPVGLVHAIRRAVYAAGQASRPRLETA